MKFVSPFLKRVLYPSLAKAGVFRRSHAGGLSIVTYHGVLPEGYHPLDPVLDGSLVSVSALRDQLRLLRNNFNIISPERLLDRCNGKYQLPERAVLVTCDDGLVNVITDMLPVLREEKVPCLFFVIGLSATATCCMLWYEELYLMLMTAREGPFSLALDSGEISGSVGTKHQRDELYRVLVGLLEKLDYEHCSDALKSIRTRLGLCDQFASSYMADPVAHRRFRLLGPEDLRTLLAEGMSIGAHTLSHPMLSQLPEDRAWFEITEGRDRLTKLIGREVWAFAYPFGGADSVSPRVLEMVQSAGYKAGFLNFGGGLGAHLPQFALPRVHVTGEMSLPEFEAHVSGFYRSLRAQFGRGDGLPISPAASA